MIHVLDEKNTVVTVTQTNVLDKEECLERTHEIGKILKNGSKITIAGFGEMKDERTKSNLTYMFPHLGSFDYNGRVLSFASVWNEIGQCFDGAFGKTKPCPRNEFPIKKPR